jgi:hypothetical protein
MGSQPTPPDQAIQKTWFDHMTGYLKWKVIGPDIHNPFKTPLPIHILCRMVNQREYLSQYIQVRCLCDGYEVMIITNPNAPRVISNHPCISQMDKGEIVDYIRREGLDAVIDAEIDRIHEEITNYLKMRENEIENEESAAGGSTLKSKKSKSKKQNKDENGSKNYRIVRK